jgi:hypothetical protein
MGWRWENMLAMRLVMLLGELLLWVKLLGWHWLVGSEKEWALE